MPGLKPPLFWLANAAIEAPLFHGGIGDFVRSSHPRNTAKPSFSAAKAEPDPTSDISVEERPLQGRVLGATIKAV